MSGVGRSGDRNAMGGGERREAGNGVNGERKREGVFFSTLFFLEVEIYFPYAFDGRGGGNERSAPAMRSAHLWLSLPEEAAAAASRSAVVDRRERLG